MSEKVCWKSDKGCLECKEKMRQEIIKEIQGTSGCKECSGFMKVVRKELEKAPRVK
ncbi:hypothetical protein [Wukongibacter sp. M2B1]|uniref:hypothetical protein n=1 Tax=Wukongibacter sp. M2B1 TaxID=3088895 RepID=UPI003D7BCB16